MRRQGLVTTGPDGRPQVLGQDAETIFNAICDGSFWEDHARALSQTEVEALYRAAVVAGERDAYGALVGLLESRGRHDEARSVDANGAQRRRLNGVGHQAVGATVLVPGRKFRSHARRLLH